MPAASAPLIIPIQALILLCVGRSMALNTNPFLPRKANEWDEVLKK